MVMVDCKTAVLYTHITQCTNKRFCPSSLSFSVRLDGQKQCKDKAFIPHRLQNGRRVIKVNCVGRMRLFKRKVWNEGENEEWDWEEKCEARAPSTREFENRLFCSLWQWNRFTYRPYHIQSHDGLQFSLRWESNFGARLLRLRGKNDMLKVPHHVT